MGAMVGESLAETESFVKGLWFGNPKQGKTTELAGAARLGRIVAIDTEGEGWLAGPLRKRGIPVENITKFRATSYEDMEQIFWEVKGMFDDAEQSGNESLAPVAVCVDHLTDLEARLVTAARDGRVEKDMQRGKEVNVFKNERDDYGVWTNQARKLMRLYRDLPCHVAFAAHVRTDLGLKVPALTEKFRIDLMGSLNMIIGAHTMQIGDTLAYVGACREVNGWQGGDRFDVTPMMVVNPSFDRMIAAAQGKLDFDTDPDQQEFKQLVSG